MYDYDDGNSTTTSTPSTEPILTPEAIANIVVTGTVIIFLTLSIGILFCTFEKGEHKLRVRTALERNKQIDKQIAFEKHMKEVRAERFRQKQAAEAAANVLQVRTTVTESGEVRYEEAGSQATQVNMEIEDKGNESDRREATKLLTETDGSSPNDIVVDLESNSDSPLEAQRQLVTVPLDSYTPAVSVDQQHPGAPAVILVQPVRDS